MVCDAMQKLINMGFEDFDRNLALARLRYDNLGRLIDLVSNQV